MFAKFAIHRAGQTRLFYGRGLVSLCIPIFARGPGYATTIVTDLPECLSADFAASGFAIDHDRRHAVLCDASVEWDAGKARARGVRPGLIDKVEGLRSLDLYPFEACLAEPMETASTFDGWVAALQALPLQDTWRGWAVEWIPTGALPEAVGQIARSMEGSTTVSRAG